MNKGEIFDKVKEIFEAFFNNEVAVALDTTMEDLEQWESVAHIQLIFEIEEAFGIEFGAEEIGTLSSIQRIVESIGDKVK